MKYYIKKTNKKFNTIEYKQYKCIDGFTKNKKFVGNLASREQKK